MTDSQPAECASGRRSSVPPCRAARRRLSNQAPCQLRTNALTHWQQEQIARHQRPAPSSGALSAAPIECAPAQILGRAGAMPLICHSGGWAQRGLSGIHNPGPSIHGDAGAVDSRPAAGAAPRNDEHASHGPPLAHHAFLRHRGDQRPVAREDRAARKATAAMQVRRLLRIQQPIVGAERAMNP